MLSSRANGFSHFLSLFSNTSVMSAVAQTITYKENNTRKLCKLIFSKNYIIMDNTINENLVVNEFS